MALTFPDPNLEPTYTAPNGITYSWDVDDEKWVVGSFSNGSGIYYQEDAPNPDLNPDLNLQDGDLWVDSDDNKMYVWTGSAWSEITACNGDTDVTKEYVDAQDDKLQQEIIKLQEEISAIAPSTDVGVWKDGATPNPSEGQFVMRLPGGAVTQQYSDPTTNLIIINKTDSRGAKYNFEDVNVGQLIQLFDVIDQNFGTYVIDAIDNADATLSP